MKKINLLALTAIIAALIFSSCTTGTGAKEVTLNSQEDSLNYALGVLNGESIKASYFMNDSTNDNLAKLLKASDEAFNEKNNDEIYTYGKQIGSMLKEQKSKGLMFDSTLTFKEKLIVQGIVNGMKGFEEAMSIKDGKEYLQTTMMKLQQKRQQEMMQSEPMPIDSLTTEDSAN